MSAFINATSSSGVEAPAVRPTRRLPSNPPRMNSCFCASVPNAARGPQTTEFWTLTIVDVAPSPAAISSSASASDRFARAPTGTPIYASGNGTVEKIEPQAVVQQNVTMFPVRVNIPNPGHLLKPGMSVTPTVCSNWADNERSRVTAVQPSSSISTS